MCVPCEAKRLIDEGAKDAAELADGIRAGIERNAAYHQREVNQEEVRVLVSLAEVEATFDRAVRRHRTMAIQAMGAPVEFRDVSASME